jgi:hypothetical protein
MLVVSRRLTVLIMVVVTGAMTVVIERIRVTRHPELKQGMSVRQFRAASVVDWHTEQANRGDQHQQPAGSTRLICQPAPDHSTAPSYARCQRGW